MADCEIISACLFFNDKMKDQPGQAELFKRRYCKGGEKDNCARYMVRNALGKEKVPTDLFPNQVEKAKALIAQK